MKQLAMKQAVSLNSIKNLKYKSYKTPLLNFIKIAMRSKAISPMIAVVLLIAFTISIGGILSIWLTTFTSVTTSSVETAATNQTKCTGTYIDVISVTSSAILITNRGSQNITNPVCYWGNGTLIDNFGTSLASGAINSSVKDRGNQSSVICTGGCLNTGVSGECKSGHSCWK